VTGGGLYQTGSQTGGAGIGAMSNLYSSQADVARQLKNQYATWDYEDMMAGRQTGGLWGGLATSALLGGLTGGLGGAFGAIGIGGS